jgi:sialidase-1
MDKGVVINTEDKWQGHPDVALFRTNNQDCLFVVYRESEHHKTNENTSIKVVKSSLDGNGFSFGEPVTLFESGTEGRYNCPRLSVVDDKLFCIVDYIKNDDSNFISAENTEGNTEIHSRRTINVAGIDIWHPQQKFPGITGIVPDRLLRYNGSYVLATHMARPSVVRHLDGRLVQDIWINSSDESGLYNWEKCLVAGDMIHNLCEASVFKINDKHLGCLMRENSQKGLPAFYCRSQDGGRNWTKHKPTRIFGCHRPVMGKLKSGNFFVTYREQSSIFSQDCWARNTFSAIVMPTDEGYPNFNQINILPLDHDRSSKPDGGYTGWVQLPDESIFIVNYITDDSPKPQIRYYVVKEDEYYDKNLIGDFF